MAKAILIISISIITVLPSTLEDSFIIHDPEPIILIENGLIYEKFIRINP